MFQVNNKYWDAIIQSHQLTTSINNLYQGFAYAGSQTTAVLSLADIPQVNPYPLNF